MPFNKQFSFVFTRDMADDAALARAISHEIAHGAFNLYPHLQPPARADL